MNNEPMTKEEIDRRIAVLSELLGRVLARRMLYITIIPDAHFAWEATGNITRTP